MSEKQLRDLIAFASDFCDRIFKAKGEIYPMWHAVTSDGKDIPIVSPLEDKDLSVAMIRALFDLRDVVRYVYIDEAWTLSRMVRPDEDEQVRREGISKHPDRVEIVMITGEDREYGGQLMAHRNIIRPRKGKPYLGPLQSIEDLPFIPPGGAATTEGRMVGLLPVRGARH
jgi:hypothetical protein